MKKYKYQLHAHTLPCSACSHLSPQELCEALHESGYQGAVLTNHFYHGNTGIPRGNEVEWKTFVEAYECDYQKCVEEAKKYDLDILFGIEESVEPGLEILCYGVTPKMLYEHPQLRKADLSEWAKIMRSYGVVVIQAHPFREVWYIPKPGMLPLEYIDGIEVYNRGNAGPEMDAKAVAYANEHTDLIRTSGGDVHRSGEMGFGGIAAFTRLRTETDLADCLRRGEYELIIGAGGNQYI